MTGPGKSATKRTIRRKELREIVPLATAQSMKWNNAGNFLDASLSPLGACVGIWPK